jgi:hypothetical protein
MDVQPDLASQGHLEAAYQDRGTVLTLRFGPGDYIIGSSIGLPGSVLRT